MTEASKAGGPSSSQLQQHAQHVLKDVETVKADAAALAIDLIKRATEKGTGTSSSEASRRYCVAIAGIPGSGKSTFAEALVRELNRNEPIAILVGMDGFHRTRAELDRDPDPVHSHARRGAPFTFDPLGFLNLCRQIRSKETCYAPSFSHAEKDPVADSIAIKPQHRIVVYEGSFLLLDEAPWSEISSQMDETWFYDVDEAVALKRIIKRHVSAGLSADEAEAERRAQQNDVLNGRLILSKLVRPDKRLVEA